MDAEESEFPDSPLLSYIKGHTGTALLHDRTAFAYVDKWAAVNPDKEAFVFRPDETARHSITYGELKKATERLAVWFRRNFQLCKGDRVGILSVNRLEYVLCDLALSRLGAVYVRLFATMNSQVELTRCLTATDCRLLLCQVGSLPTAHLLLPMLNYHDPLCGKLVAEELPRLEQVVVLTEESHPGCISLPNYQSITVTEAELEGLYSTQSGITLDDDCTIYGTSGSTGAPKFMIKSYGAVLAWPHIMLQQNGMGMDDRYFSDRPLAYLGGTASTVLPTGGTMIIANPWRTVAEKTSTPYLTAILEEEHVTCGLSFPYILYDLVKSGVEPDRFKKLKFFMFCGQQTNPEIIRVVRESLGIPLINGYGCTEVGEVSSTSVRDPLDITAKFVGHALPGVEVKIVDEVTKEIVPREQPGLIAIRKQQKWRYINHQQNTASHDDDGYFYPGDIARMTENGRLEILGRIDDVISVGTVKVYPSEIEMMICKHPLVDKAIVFGVPNTRLREVIGAVVLPKPQVTSWYEPNESFYTKFPEFGTSYEECRAECAALYLCLSKKIEKIFGNEGQQADDVIYISWLTAARAGLRALSFYTPETNIWGEVHMMAAYVILRVLLEAGNDFVKVSQFIGTDGEPDMYVELDRTKIESVGVPAIGKFLVKLQVYKSTADYEAAKEMYLTYATVSDAEEPRWLQLREIAVRRIQHRKLLVQGNTLLSDDGTVILREYEHSTSGLIQSIVDRFPANDVDTCLYKQWMSEYRCHVKIPLN